MKQTILGESEAYVSNGKELLEHWKEYVSCMICKKAHDADRFMGI
jgi:hypothetical protein